MGLVKCATLVAGADLSPQGPPSPPMGLELPGVGLQKARDALHLAHPRAFRRQVDNRESIAGEDTVIFQPR